MPKKKRWSKRDIPRCPDPENYILVKTMESVFWRRKRSNGKVNASFATNVDLSKICGPAATRIVRRLRPFMNGIDAGRITQRVSNALRKFFKEKNQLSLSALEGIEIQRDYPLHQLLVAPYEVIVDGISCRIRIGTGDKCVKKQNNLATHFYFEEIVLSGDPTKENGLKLETIESKLYAFDEEIIEVCDLSLSLPEDDQPWVVLLKVSCLEGNEIAVHPKHYGMKMVKVNHT
jgi:hypothetical protein